MLNPRHALVATVAAVTLIPAGHAQASIDGAQAVRTLAADAAELLAQEATLVADTNPTSPDSPSDLAGARTELRTIDGQGASILVQLRGLGVSLTPAIETALGRLPIEGTDGGVPVFPQQTVYNAAISDLLRIASTPAAVAPVGDGSDGPSSALLLVAATSLLILGGAALTKTLWRRPEHHELAALAWNDGLTGLANRRRLDHDLDAAGRHGSISVIMIDVDLFEEIKNVYGHEAGDDVLKRLATMFEHHVRRGDVVYRYDGEGFCLVLPGATVDDATAVADRILEAARKITLPSGENLTVSVGVADVADDELGTVLERADRALALAKQQGRDRVVHAGSDLVTA